MKIRVCDICKEKKEIYFKCKIKRNTMTFLDCGEAVPDTSWFRAEICEDCLNKIAHEVSE